MNALMRSVSGFLKPIQAEWTPSPEEIKAAREKELKRRTKEFTEFLLGETTTAVGTFLGSAQNNSNITAAQIQSEAEAEARIRRAATRMLLPFRLVEPVTTLALLFSYGAIEQAKHKLGLAGILLYIHTRRVQKFAEDCDWYAMELRRIANAWTDRVIVESPTLPPMTVLQETDQARQIKVEGRVKAKELRGQLFRLRLKSLAVKVGAMFLASIDSSLTFLVIAEAYRGTEGSFVALPYLLTFGVVVALIWGAHELARLRIVGGSIFLIITAALGLLRAGIGGLEGFDAASLSLGIANIAPIPVISYLAAKFLDKAKAIDDKTDKILTKIAQELRDITLSRGIESEIKKFNAFRAKMQQDHN